ncbi:hypothetical protein EBB07_34305 [Paenibacillaceae bacterium]|nr:hypothetical protein EBB07_34305 [Paenibacillaceae bacterium]
MVLDFAKRTHVPLIGPKQGESEFWRTPVPLFLKKGLFLWFFARIAERVAVKIEFGTISGK